MKKIFYLLLATCMCLKAFSQCPAADAGPDKCILPGNTVNIGPASALPNTLYSWAPATGLSSTSISNPNASPSTTTTYTVTQTVVLPQNLVTNGDFELGNTGFTSNYALFPPSSPGHYLISGNPTNMNPAFCTLADHTTGAGNMMIVDGSLAGATDIIWSQTVNVQARTNYVLTIFAATPNRTLASPVIGITVNGNIVLAPQTIPNGTANFCQWRQYTTTFNTINATTAQINIYSTATVGAGNDVLLDDIQLLQICKEVSDDMTVHVSNVNTLAIQSATSQEGISSPVAITNLTGDNALCFGWESSVTTRFNSNFSSNNTWIVNDVPITLSGYYPGVGSFLVNNNSQELVHTSAQNNTSIKYQLSNNDNGCIYTTPAMYVRPVWTYYPGSNYVAPNSIDEIGSRTVNQEFTIKMNYGSPTTYTWSFPAGVSTYDASTSTPEIYISTISPTYTPVYESTCNCSYIPVQLVIANNPQGCNGTYNVHFLVPNGLRTASPKGKSKTDTSTQVTATLPILKEVSIYPNPANNLLQVQVPDSFNLLSIQIFNSSGQLLKSINQLKVNAGFYLIPVQDFPTGVYILSMKSKNQTMRSKFSVSR